MLLSQLKRPRAILRPQILISGFDAPLLFRALETALWTPWIGNCWIRLAFRLFPLPNPQFFPCSTAATAASGLAEYTSFCPFGQSQIPKLLFTTYISKAID
jgi:hypothetical protein